MSFEADTVAVDIPVSSLNLAEMPLTLDSRPIAAVEASSSESDTLLQLPSDFLKTPFTGYQAKWYSFALSNTLLTDCQQTTQKANLQAFFLAAFNAVLHRYTQQEEIYIEVTLANGVSAKSYTTEIYTQRLGELQVRDLLAQTEAKLETSIEQLKVSCPDSTESLSLKRCSNSPVAFTFVENTIDSADQTKLAEDWHNRSQTTLEQLSEHPDLHLIIFQQPRHLFGIIQYNGNLFEPATIQRLAGHLQVLTEGMVADLDRSIAQLPLLTAAEEQQLLGDWMSASVAYPQAPIHQLIETHALQRPNKTAVTFKTQQLTYAELNQQANQLAHYLNQTGVASGSRVAVCLEPSLDVAVSLLGIFKAGAIYVPLDPTHPIDRLATILEDNQPQILITQSHLLPNLPSIEGQVFCCDQDWQTIQHLSIENPQNRISLDQTAYLVYTSGTTGKPKGVMASHGNLVNYILVAQDRYDFNRDDIMPAIARFTFSITMFELLSPLAAGGTLMLLEREHILDFKRMVQTLEQVTVIHTSPSLMRKLLAYIQEQGLDLQRFQSLRHVSTGGDLVPADLVETMKAVFQNAEVFVIYGCSEISCMGCTYPIPRDQTVSKSKVGKPFSNVSVRLYDAQQNLVPIGIVGEIYFGGNGITQGYLNRDELTQEKFVMIDGQRFYRTGDMGRFDAEGNLEILGRSDFQIKLRGIRIELGEIETTLRQAPGVRDGVVALRELGDEPALIAYVVLHREETSLVNNIRAFLQERLPDYMVPAGFVVLEALPVNLNQKVDRRALPAPTPENLAGFAEYVPPQDEWQQKLVQIWEEVLGIHPIGIRNGFLELGGNSLLAVQMLTQVEKVFERELPITMLLKCPTIEALAEAMQTVSDEASEGDIVPLQTKGSKPPIFCIYGLLLYQDLATYLDADHPVYGVYLNEEVDLLKTGKIHEYKSAFSDIPSVAARYLQVVRQAQPHGPYYLAGESFGGIIAYEMAQQLRAAGEEVALVAMFDAWFPSHDTRKPLLQRLQLHGRLLLQHRMDYVRKKSRPLKQKLKRTWVKGLNKLVGKKRLQSSQPAVTEGGMSEDMRGQARQQLSDAYVAQPYPGKVALFRAMERDPFEADLDGDLGWGKVACGNFRVFEVPGDHLGILKDPNVKVLAKQLRSCLVD